MKMRLVLLVIFMYRYLIINMQMVQNFHMCELASLSVWGVWPGPGVAWPWCGPVARQVVALRAMPGGGEGRGMP